MVADNRSFGYKAPVLESSDDETPYRPGGPRDWRRKRPAYGTGNIIIGLLVMMGFGVLALALCKR